jgi:hypothetical protein
MIQLVRLLANWKIYGMYMCVCVFVAEIDDLLLYSDMRYFNGLRVDFHGLDACAQETLQEGKSAVGFFCSQ